MHQRRHRRGQGTEPGQMHGLERRLTVVVAEGVDHDDDNGDGDDDGSRGGKGSGVRRRVQLCGFRAKGGIRLVTRFPKVQKGE